MTVQDDRHCWVCGREVAEGEGIRECYGGQVCCFDRRECQAKLEADPERYLEETIDVVRPLGYT